MGLPIFLLTAETELPHKASKLRSSSPPRTSIRREDRERRQRRAVRLYGNAPPSRPEFGRSSPWPEPPTAAAPGSESQMPRSREVLREMSNRFDNRRRERIEEQMTSIFGNNWQDAGQPGDRYESDLGWWSLDGRPRVSRPRHVPTPPLVAHVPPLGAREPRHPSPNDSTPRSRPALARVVIDVPQALGANQSQQSSFSQRRSNLNHDSTLLDGLGDRQRSVSPAEWDTLLTTLTPDPQPPSVNSSFASAPTTSGPSQASGSTSATTLPPQSLLTGEDHCETGWENSDIEESAQMRADRRRRAAAPGANLNTDGGPDGPAIFGIRVHRNDRDATGRSTNRDGAGSRNELLRAVAGDRQGDAWVGRALMGAAESRDGDGSRRPTRESSSGATPIAGQGDDDFSGMQHIVRGLASREDIPDEWWAEVGLSRTLPQEGSN